jgi:gluconolactonase
MRNVSTGRAQDWNPELVASGLGFPEGPAPMSDGALVFVDQYRFQLTIIGLDGAPRPFAWTGGSPNSCALGADGAFYVCQNGGTVGPWRAPEMIAPSIQTVREGGRAEALITEVQGVKLNGPNDLAFAPDGSLIFTDPGVYNPKNPDPSYIHRVAPDGAASVVIAFPKPVFPHGVTVEPDGSIVWDESYTGRVGRLRPNGKIEDLGRLPGDNPIPDGLKVGADGRLYVTDVMGKGIHVLAPDGEPEGFIPCGAAPTNCAFAGDILWVTDAGLTSLGAEATSNGCIWRLRIPGGGAPSYKGAITEPQRRARGPS